MEFQHETGHGILTLTVLRADEKRVNRDGVNVVEIEPTVQLSGAVKYRGRLYSIDVHYAWQVASQLVHAKGWTTAAQTHWRQSYVPYNGGYRNDRGSTVEYRTPTRDALEGMVTAALAWLEKEHPEWQFVSKRKRLEGIQAHATGKVAEARRELAKACAEETAASEALATFIQAGSRP
jgi:hypothetical protein